MKKLISILALALIVSPILAMDTQGSDQSGSVVKDTITEAPTATGSGAGDAVEADNQGDDEDAASSTEEKPTVDAGKKGLFTSAKDKVVGAASFVTTKAGDAAGAVNTKFWDTYNSEKGGLKLSAVALGALTAVYGMYQTYAHNLVSRGWTRVKSGVKSLNDKWHNRGKNKAVNPKEAIPAA